MSTEIPLTVFYFVSSHENFRRSSVFRYKFGGLLAVSVFLVRVWKLSLQLLAVWQFFIYNGGLPSVAFKDTLLFVLSQDSSILRSC